MRNIPEERIEITLNGINWRIEDLKETIAYRKEELECELSRFNERTSPRWLAQYAADMEEARKELESLYNQKKWFNFLLGDEGGDENEK